MLYMYTCFKNASGIHWFTCTSILFYYKDKCTCIILKKKIRQEQVYIELTLEFDICNENNM